MRAYIGPFPEGDEEREVDIQIDRHDLHDLSSTIATLVAPLLKEFKKDLTGAAFVDNEDVPEKLRASPEEVEAQNHGDLDPLFFDRWGWVLDEMEWTFSTLARDWEIDFYHDGLIEGMNQIPESSLIPGTGDFSVDEEGIKATKERIDNGLRLFGKYFQGLWD